MYSQEYSNKGGIALEAFKNARIVTNKKSTYSLSKAKI
jgi:hypothetical protein